ncbi:MAG: polysaccharide biosynthesis/export family protein [Verrucomicrobia bacterium]|nr:polysaccharide biosynthesis/export family protein [Verrucomicrobiota bacterium]
MSAKAQSIDEVGPTRSAVTSMDQLDNTTLIGVGDQLSFRITQDEAAPSQLTVDDAGFIEVPFVGKILAAGKTPRQLALDCKKALEAGLYKKATVLISLERRTRSPGTIYITGEVARQGPIELPANETLTVTTAILRAGGFSDFANKRKVKVLRKTGKGEKVYIVDVKNILEKARGDLDFPVLAGDVILVPARLINW